jgi:hypothetical protein
MEVTMSMLPPEVDDLGPAPTPAERRLAESRAALAELVAPARGDEFPRSETMRFVMGGKGRIVALGLVTGLLLVNPKLAAGLVRFLPLGKLLPIGKILQTLR